MKKILLCYFVLLPIILLVAFTPVVDFFRNIAWVALVLSILLIIYAVIKTRAFYHLKKVLLIVILSSLFYGGDNFVFGTSACWAETRDLSYTFEAGKKAEEKREQSHGESCAKRYEKMHEDIEKISEIPPINRTAAQQRKYNELLKSIKDLGKECKGQLEYCEPVSELYNKATQNCWACDIADLFLGAGDKVVTNFYKNVKGKVLALLAIGFFCWILIHVTKLIMSMGVGDTGKFITDFFVKCFVVGGIAIILSAPLRSVADFFISPFFLFTTLVTNTFNEISNKVPLPEGVVKIDEELEKTLGKRPECSYCAALKKENNNSDAFPDIEKVNKAIQYKIKTEERIVSPLLRNSILCSICSINRITAPPMIAGQFLMCSAKQAKSKEEGTESVYEDMDSVLVSGFIIISFFLISGLFSFYFIDSFVRVCFVLILFPFLLVAFAFESTRKYSKKGFDVLLHTMVTYIMIALFMSIIIQVFYTILGPDTKSIVDALKIAHENKDSGYEALRAALGIFGGNGGRVLLACISVCLLTYYLLQIMHGYIVQLSGVNLANSGGIGAFRSSISSVMAVTRTVQELYTQGEWTNVWRKKMDESGNLTEGTEARGRDIRAGARKFDEASENLGENVKQDIKQKGNDAANWVNNKYTRNFESNIKEAIQKEKGFRKVTKLAQNGLGYVAAKVLEGSAKVSASILGGGSKLIVKTPASIGGFIARNIYFNKTVGLFWQGGRETTQIGIDVARTKPGKWMRDITRLSKLENTKYGKKTKNAIKHFSGEK